MIMGYNAEFVNFSKKCQKIGGDQKHFLVSFYTPWGQQEPNLVQVRLLCYEEHRETEASKSHDNGYNA